MSLFSYLTSDSSSSSTSSTSSTIAAMLQQIAAQKAASSTSTTTSTTSTSSTATQSVQITTDAQVAAANSTDSKKDSATLVSDIRSTLDAQYKASGHKTADMTEFSGRALATVALNKDGSFSAGEVAEAKSTLRERDRQSALEMIKSGDLTASTLATYSTKLLSARAAMSAEENELRDANPKLR